MSEPVRLAPDEGDELDRFAAGRRKALARTRNGTADAEARAVIVALHARLRSPGADWKQALIEAIAAWPIASETVNGRRLVYLIAGEAFDWRLLAARLARAAGDALPASEVYRWLEDPDPAGGLDEPEFTRRLGVDKYRSHLSYLYGVTVERALLAAAEEEITKRRVAAGQPATERARDEAFERLYEAPARDLWTEFCASDGAQRDRGRHGPSGEHLSLGDLDAFTYWLFKRRMKRLDPARIASDTRKGLGQLERMRQADERRAREGRSRRVVEVVRSR